MTFRKVALDRLSSPEQLDQLMQVTNPRGWFALLALGGLLATALTWGILGSIPTDAAGEGILIRRGGISEVVANTNGQVAAIGMHVGDLVHAGQVVGSIRQSGLNRQIADTQARLAELTAELRALARTNAQQQQLQDRSLAQQRADLRRSIAAGVEQETLLKDRIAAEQKLLEEGLITKQTLLNSQQSLNTARDQTANLAQQLGGLELKRLAARQQIDEQMSTKQHGIDDLESQLREAKAKLAENVGVISPFDGRVLELMVNPGDLVAPGTAVMSLELSSEELMALLYVPASEGKRVQRGMTVRVSPSTVKVEEYGYMLGRVEWVSEFPSTSRGMMRLLGNEGLVTHLATQGPPIQVNVRLLHDAATPTGYKWSSSTGPNLKISSGTLSTASIIVREDRPIRLVIPAVREKLGI